MSQQAELFTPGRRLTRWLFPNKAGSGPIGRGALGRALAIAAREAGITGSTLHSLRHYISCRTMSRTPRFDLVFLANMPRP